MGMPGFSTEPQGMRSGATGSASGGQRWPAAIEGYG
jgi:hypothetical protein